MKKFGFVLALASLQLWSFAQQEVQVKTNITEVTVFLKGAQVTREAQVNLSAGNNYLVFDQLSANLNPNSIQVQGSNNFSILSVNHFREKFNEQKLTGALKRVKDSLDDTGFKLGLRNGLKVVYEEEKSMILANKSLKGESTGVNIEDLMEMSDFYHDGLKDIQYKLVEINTEIEALNQTKKLLEQRFNDLKRNQQAGASRIKLAISCKAPTNTKLSISYFVYNAGWKPDYDIRATEINQPLQLVYRGNIYQSTGSDWKNVKLRLSTGNPTTNGILPDLDTWYVDLRPAYNVYKSEVAKAKNLRTDADKEEILSNNFASGPEVNTQQNAVSTIFDISIPYDVPSNNKEYTVELTNTSITANYNYYAVPKLDKQVYLLAQVSEWESMNLLGGNANIYFRGTYVGKTFIDPMQANDTLKLSLGVDPEVVVEKEAINDYKKKKPILNNNKIEYDFVVRVKNNKTIPISLIVEDQIPVSKNKEVNVELINSSGAAYIPEKGTLRWDFNLDGGAAKNKKLTYSISYPKNQNLMFR